jgi:predicted nucleic acid-binding protein
MAIVDSSAYVKYFAKEPGWEAAASHLMQPASIGLALAEVANALAKKIALREISPDDAKMFLRKMMEITRLLREDESVIPALKMSTEKRITVYDALFIVAAIENKLGLTTSDAKQARVAEEYGVSVDLV